MAEFISSIALEIAKALAPLAAGAIVVLLVRLAQKAGLSVSADHQALAEKKITDLIFQVEELGAARLKAGLSKLKPEEKLAIVIGKAVDTVPGITADEAKTIVESQLPKLGLGATDFAKAVVAAAFNPVK